MSDKKPHNKNDDAQKMADLTNDLQRTRADFENYRKRVESEKKSAAQTGATKTVMQLLPVIDTIERAVVHAPADIADHQWVKGVSGLVKQLNKALNEMDLQRIDASSGVAFDPELHQAIQFDESASGENEVIAEELQPGYKLHGNVIRPALVKVTRQ